jgi:hypothetical protein
MRSLSVEEIRRVAGGRMMNDSLPTHFQPNTTPAGTPCINPTQAATVISWARWVGEGGGGTAGGALGGYVADGFELPAPAVNAAIGAGTWGGSQIGAYAAQQIAQSTISAYQMVVNVWEYAMNTYDIVTNQPSAASWYNQSYTQACNESGEYLFGT